MTKTELANVALGILGEMRITNISENSPHAERCRQMWDITRDAVLRRREWNFATTRKTLTRLADAPIFGWTYAYQLPANYIKAIKLNEAHAGTSQATWEIEGDLLLTNEEEANLVYIYRNETVSEWDDSFNKAFATALAAAVSPSITSSISLTDNLEAKAERHIVKAGGASMMEDRPRCVMAHQDSEWLKARGGARNW
jgi:hypothetical protein